MIFMLCYVSIKLTNTNSMFQNTINKGHFYCCCLAQKMWETKLLVSLLMNIVIPSKVSV